MPAMQKINVCFCVLAGMIWFAALLHPALFCPPAALQSKVDHYYTVILTNA